MARSESGRVTKRSSARLRSISTSGTVDLARLITSEDGVGRAEDPTNDTLEFCEEEDSVAIHEPATMTGSKDTEAMLVDDSEPPSQVRDKGKGRAIDALEGRLFPFMELPTELRLEIYRACLTRPYKIMLSKATESRSESVNAEGEEGIDDIPEMHWLNDQDREQNLAMLQQMRVQNPGVNAIRTANPMIGRSARAGNQARPSHLVRPIAPRRRHPHTMRFSSAFVPPTLQAASPSNGSSAETSALHHHIVARPPSARQSRRPQKPSLTSRTNTPKSSDPLIINILRANKAVYKEARGLLYSENKFNLSIDTAVSSLAALHQRSRRLIRHVELEIHSYTEIQDKFSEVVRLSLRYCSGLRTLVIHTPFCLPGGDGTTTPNSNTQIWAQGFDILRWLPQQCDVVLMGQKNVEIEQVVNKHLHLAKTLSPVSTSSGLLTAAYQC